MSNHHDDSSDTSLLYAVPPPDDYDGDTTPEPHDLDAERSTLGAILIDPTAFHDVQAVLEPDDFYQPAHELIYDAAATLYAAGAPVDAVTVCDELTKRGDLRRTGGAPYLHQLIMAAPVAATASWHARIVADHAQRRRVLHATRRIAHLATNPTTDPSELHTVALAALQQAAPLTPGTTSTWAPVDVTAVLDGDIHEQEPTVLARTDGARLLYPSAVHSISGEPESGKTWFALKACADELNGGNPVVFVDFEDRASRVLPNLIAAGAHPHHVRDHFRYIRPDTGITAATLPHLLAAARGATLAVVDGITEAMTLHGLSLMDNEDVARWLTLVPRALADAGCAVLQIDHVVKNPENRGRYAIGGQHKLAGIDGCSYKITVTEPFGRGKRGHARITVDKDRPGYVRAISFGHTVATLTIDSRATERHTADQLRIYLEPPGDDVGPDGAFRPTHLMEKVSKFVEVNPGCSGRAITEVVKGKSAAVRDAIRALTTEGYIRTEPGEKRSVLHWSDRPYREDEDG